MNTAATQLIPREVLFGNPVKSSPQISPDGKRLAYLAPVDNALNVWVGSLDGNDYQPVTEDKERGYAFISGRPIISISATFRILVVMRIGTST